MANCVIISAENLASNGVAGGLIDGSSQHIAEVLLLPNFPIKSQTNRGRAKRLLGKTVWQFVMFKILEIFVSTAVRTLLNRTIAAKARKKGIPVSRFTGPSDPALLNKLQTLDCDILLSAGPSILSRDILGQPSMFTLNCHCARLPEYQGPANYIWMSIDKVKRAYVSVQIMEAEIDAGEVIAEDYIHRESNWSVYQFNWQLAKFAGRFYANILNRIIDAGSLQQADLPLDNKRETHAKNRGFPGKDDFAKLRKNNDVLLFRVFDLLRFF